MKLVSVAHIRRVLQPGTKVLSVFPIGPIAGKTVERTVLEQSKHQMVLTSARTTGQKGYMTWEGVRAKQDGDTFVLYNEYKQELVRYTPIPS